MSTEHRTVDDLLETGDVVSLVTGDLRGRPMTVQEVVGSEVWFLTSRSADWVEGLTVDDRAGLLLADDDDALWASLVGTAVTVEDRARIEDMWSAFNEPWFDGPDDPDLVALRVQLREGEWWDAPGSRVVQAVRMVAAAVSDDATVGGQGDVATT